jgi:hypothetical protein
MANTSQEQSSEGDVHRCFRDINAGLMVALESTPTAHPDESAFNDSAPGQDIEVWIAGVTLHDLNKSRKAGR